jgi:fatty-acyl-CoA synthase
MTPLTPLRCLHRAVDLFGSKIGVVSGDREFTYREFGQRAERLATGLRAFGIAAGDRVAYLSFNNNELLEGYYGVIQAGAVVMPLNVRLSALELAGILNHAEPAMLIFEADFAPLIAELKRACGSVRHWVGIGEGVPEAGLSYEEILAAGKPERADIYAIDENALAELFYTSGSTGTPKGVMLTHRTLYVHALDTLPLYKDHESMVDLHTIPLFHANGWGRPQASTLLGTRQVMVRRFDPPTVLDLIARHRATHMCLVPTMANALLNSPALAQADVSSLRQVLIGGAAASPELIERVEKAFHCECVSGYGMTETSPVLTTSLRKATVHYASPQERYRRQAMAGWPVVGVEVRVVDGDMNDVPRDGLAIGEVVARGDHIMAGYFREPQQTAAIMTGQWLHTGDMAVWDEEGYIQIVDRKKEIIISGGENISSIEVEKAIFAHPAVLECAVVAAPDPKWGEVPAAIVVLKPGATLTSDELLGFLEGRLGRYKMPKLIQFQQEALPKTGTGKIRKLVIKEQFWQGKDKRVQG